MSRELLHYNTPILAPIMVDINNPPLYPSIPEAPADIQYLIPTVSAMVINEAVSTIVGSHARLFYYNLLSVNNYQNETFSDVVKLTIGTIYVECVKGHYRSFESASIETVKKVTGLFVSSLFFQYPELKSMVSPQILNAAHQNINIYKELCEEVNAMYRQGGFVVNPNQIPGGNMQPGMQPGFQGHMVNNQQFVNQQFPNNQQFVNQQQYPVNQQFPNNQQFVNPGMNRTYPPSVSQAPFINRDIADSRFSRGSSVNQHPQQPIPVKAPEPVIVKEPRVVVLNTFQKNEYEFAKQAVNFFGTNISMNNIERQNQHKQSISKLSKEKAGEAEEGYVNKFIYPTCLIETSLDNAITDGRIKQFELQNNDTDENVFRCFVIIGNPVFSTSEMDRYIEVIRGCTNFVTLSDKIKAIGAAASLQQDKKYVSRILTFLNTIENTFTEFINDFLNNKLNIDITINSFCEDSTELPGYLETKFGINYKMAYDQFEEEAVSSLLEDLDNDLMITLIDELVLPETLKLEIIPVNHSLTYTFLNNKELGFDTGNKLNIIDPESSPSLYQLIVSLQRHKNEMGVTTMVDMLITADNYRYRLYRDYKNDCSNTYYIKRV